MTFRRPFGLVVVAALSAAAMAENYQAIIYGLPPGKRSFEIMGAGDNGMLTGTTIDALNSEYHATFLTSTGTRDIHPIQDGIYNSEIFDSWGSTYHCGRKLDGIYSKALFWVGGGSPVDLHPTSPSLSDFNHSSANAGFGQIQVGGLGGQYDCPQCGNLVGSHAVRWSRTAQSATLLHAPGFVNFGAGATDGVTHGGSGNKLTGGYRALLWKQNSLYATDISPAGYNNPEITSIWGSQQGGTGSLPGQGQRALLWSGTAESVVSLHPAGFNNSYVTSIRAGLQVGYGNHSTTTSREQAIAWHGNAATWINLHARLPYPFILWHSYATDIDNLGNIVGYLKDPATQNKRPVIWKRI